MDFEGVAMSGSSSSGPNHANAVDSDAQWFVAEVKPHEPALRAFLHREYPALSDIDDVVQESFLKTLVAKQRGKLTSVRGFLFTVASHASVSFFRKRKRLSPIPVSELPALRVLVDDVDVLENVCSQEELALVADAIAELPGRCREVAMLRLLRGLDCATIARQLGISEPTVRVQLARAMKKSADYLRARGLMEGVRR